MVETRTKYVAYRKNVAVDWTSNAAESATKIMALETVLATNHMKKKNQKRQNSITNTM
jgi:hypothetical protein